MLRRQPASCVQQGVAWCTCCICWNSTLGSPGSCEGVSHIWQQRAGPTGGTWAALGLEAAALPLLCMCYSEHVCEGTQHEQCSKMTHSARAGVTQYQMCSLWLQGWSGAGESGRPTHPVSRDNSWRIEVSPSQDLLTTCLMSWHQSAAQRPLDKMAAPDLQTLSKPLCLCDCWGF